MRLSVRWVLIVVTVGCTESITAPRPGDPTAANGGPAGPATRLSVPAKYSLLEFTVAPAIRSPLGDLRKVTMRASDVELRFWAGFGLVGTSGLIVSRRKGKWSAQRADMEPCMLTIPMSVGDTLSEASIARYEQLAFDRCAHELSGEGGRFFRVDKLVLTPLPVPSNMDELWESAMRDGLFDLPTGVARDFIMLDGHSFVIEVRIGAEYRATDLACVGKSTNSVDVKVRELGQLFQAAFPKAWGLSCY